MFVVECDLARISLGKPWYCTLEDNIQVKAEKQSRLDLGNSTNGQLKKAGTLSSVLRLKQDRATFLVANEYIGFVTLQDDNIRIARRTTWESVQPARSTARCRGGGIRLWGWVGAQL